MSSVAIGFVHAIRKCSKKFLAQKVVRFGSPGRIPMIQPLFCTSYVALQYETGMKLHDIKYPENFSITTCCFFEHFSKSM